MTRARKKANDKEYIVRYIGAAADGTHVIEHPDGRLEHQKSRTDWDKLAKLTDEEINASIVDDPDWEEFKDIDWSKAVLVIPAKKKAISLRVDGDVLDFFKKGGPGYQRRMNAVLRSYMEQRRKTKKRA